MSKLTDKDIAGIRAADDSVTNAELARKYGVTDVTIHYHRRGAGAAAHNNRAGKRSSVQSQRLPLYQATAEKLVASGHAYYCFCTKEELEKRRAAATAAGRPPMYDRRCRAIDPVTAASRKSAGEAAAVRFSVPDGGSTAFADAVFGKVEFANAEIEDFVLLRSDGIPTYHLSVVADDIDMRLTHVIRGADHISNTPKQVLQYQALGAELPIFAHVPLILGPDKTRLSKRHGATSAFATSASVSSRVNHERTSSSSRR
jgi:glutamyl-tRNA synthetase